jgi:hypothetical protein
MNGQLVQDFQNYSNSFGQGYLKSWKANSILWQLSKDSGIFDDEVRFLAYLKNCLEMEGFRGADIELIMGWLYERKMEICS